MKADLHVHSHYSDGSDSVEEVLNQAQQQGVTHLSFVDHDTVAGVWEAIERGRRVGIEVISGIEISAYDFKRNRKVHVLGYAFSVAASAIQALCQPLLDRRHAHSLWQMERIAEAGYSVEHKQVARLALPSETIYKQHIMAHLTDAPFSSPSYQTLYRSLFKGDGPAAGDIIYADAFDAVRAIKEDGGLAVVAHPGQLDSYDLIPELVEIGLDGVERNHPDHSSTDHAEIDELARDYDLLLTGGSDYHGSFGTPVTIGSEASNLSNDDRFLQLCKRKMKEHW
ncbi:PHP domain-containing protein [Alkalihalobacillus sp. FSL W8-0930]